MAKDMTGAKKGSGKVRQTEVYKSKDPVTGKMRYGASVVDRGPKNSRFGVAPVGPRAQSAVRRGQAASKRAAAKSAPKAKIVAKKK